VTGSTLYRRLPNGSWAAQREDLSAGAGDDGAQEAEMANVGAVPVVAGVLTAGASTAGSPSRSAAPGAGPVGAVTADPAPAEQQPTLARRWSFWRILVWALAAYVLWLVALMVYAAASLNKVEALSPDPIADTDGAVWLLVGSDSRDGLSKKEQKKLKTGDVEGQRTDTIMVVHQKLGETPTLVSIPRDSWVTIPAHTATDGTQVEARGGKINSAFSYGGAPLLSETIEYNTGLHVDHYMEVGMGGIVDLTDAVGGVGVCFDEAITDENSGLDVEAGCQTLDGAEALAWVRMRYADPKGDLGRIERQRQYIALMVDQVLSVRTLVNPFRQLAIVNAGVEAVLVAWGWAGSRPAAARSQQFRSTTPTTGRTASGSSSGTPRSLTSCSPRWAGAHRRPRPTPSSAPARSAGPGRVRVDRPRWTPDRSVRGGRAAPTVGPWMEPRSSSRGWAWPSRRG
jgi:LCP family protein required for cell wall assembly